MNSLVGRIVGDYRLDAVIGSGNLGIVYQAQHITRGEPAAVKVVHDRLVGDPGFPDRFRRIVSAAANLRHPHVVQITGYGESGGDYYVAMELLARGSLRSMLERREDRPSIARGVELMRQGAEAMAYAHGMSVLHRDLKPENIMLSRGESASGGSQSIVRVVDWGFMQLIDTGITVVGNMTPGSPRYMSPEQCGGKPLDSRSDIYSFGVVLYEVATGYPPFQVQNLADAIEKHLSATPATPRSVNSAVPEPLEAIILRCLAKKPDQRYQSAGELAQALGDVGAQLRSNAGRRVVVDGQSGERMRVAPPPAARDDQGGGLREGQRMRVRLPGDEGQRGAPRPSTPASSTPIREGDRVKVHLPASGESKPKRSRDEPPAKRSTPAAGAGATPAGESKHIRITLDRPILTLIPGQPTSLRATLFNGSRIVDHFNLSVEGVPANWVQLPATAPQLNPGDRTAVNLAINVPRIPESHAKTYKVVVRVQAMRQSTEFATSAGEWTVTPFVTSTLSLTPSRVRAWRHAEYGLKLRNDGNAPARYNIVANDDEQVLKYRFGETGVSLGPGDSATLRVDVRSRVRWIGSTESRTFMVRAEPTANLDGTPPVQQTPPITPAQYLHRAIVPLWLPPLLILAAVALWYFFLKDRNRFEIALTPSSKITVAVGAAAPVKVQVTNNKKEAVDSLVGRVAWSSDDTTLAVVRDGSVHGLKQGTTVLTASLDRVRKTLEVDVVPAQVAALQIVPPQLTITVGGRGNLRAVARDAQGNVLQTDVQWQTSNPSVAVVTNGQVIASDSGTVNVMAIAGGKIANGVITVRPSKQMLDAGGGGADCQLYEPSALRVRNDGATGWVVTDGSASLLTLDSEADARRAMSLARGYKSHCFLGRANRRPNRSAFINEYWTQSSGAPIVVDQEDCEGYVKSRLRVVENGTQGFALLDGNRTMLWADTREDAQKMWEVSQQHVKQCFIGRGNRRPNSRDYIVQYWQ